MICARGGRSAKAAEHYRSLGIDAVNVAGGTLAWIDAGLPTDSGPGGASSGPGAAPESSFRWVDDPAAFADVIAELATAGLYCLDTEFHREAHLPRPPGAAAAGVGRPDRPRRPGLGRRRAARRGAPGPGRCVMHAASRDLEILARVCGTVPAELFDTQTAAGFLGYSSVGVGLAPPRRAQVTVPKADRLTDWLVRPLPDGALSYAASDVAHLELLHDTLVTKPEERGRLQWASTSARSSGPGPPPAHAGAGLVADQGGPRPRGRAAAVAQSLAAWQANRRAAEVDRQVRFHCWPTSRWWRWPSARRPRRRTSVASAGSTRKRKGGAAKELLSAVAAGVDLPLESVQVPPAEGVDRSRRAAASLGERVGRAAGP